MEKLLRIVSALLGAFLLLMGIWWIGDPAAAVMQLQMTLQEGVARNSQIGETAALFFGMGALALYGVWKEKHDYVIAAAVLIGGIAVFRVIAVVHDAPIIWTFVGFEVVTAAVWVAYARTLRN